MNDRLNFLLAEFSCCRQHLVSFSAYPDIFSEVGPANNAGRVHQELRRARNITARRAAALMQEIVTANYVSVWIGEDRKGVTGLGCKVPRNLRRVHADGHGTHACCLKFFQVLLNASELEVAKWSPISAIED